MSDSEGMPRVLVVKQSSLGDLFHALPIVNRIHEEWGALIDWVTNEPYVGLVERFGPVNRAIGFPRHRFVSRGAAFLRNLRRDSYSRCNAGRAANNREGRDKLMSV